MVKMMKEKRKLAIPSAIPKNTTLIPTTGNLTGNRPVVTFCPHASLETNKGVFFRPPALN